MTLDKNIQTIESENVHKRIKKAPYIAGLALTLFLNTANLNGATQLYQVGAFSQTSNVTKVVNTLKTKGLKPYTIKKGNLTRVVVKGSKEQLEKIMGSPVIKYSGNIPKKKQIPIKTIPKKHPKPPAKKGLLEKIKTEYKTLTNKIKEQILLKERQEKLRKDTTYLAQFYDNFTTSDLINLVRCVDKEAGGIWSTDEYKRKQSQIGDIATIIADIGNRWVTARYDKDFKNDFNGPGKVTFSKIVQKNDLKTKKNKKTGKEYAVRVYQFSAMMDPEQRELIKRACENQDLLYGVDNPFEKEKIQFIYDATLLILPDIAKDPNKRYVTYRDHPAKIPIEYAVLYKTINTDHKKWNNLIIGGRKRRHVHTTGNHRHYTIVDSNTGENLVKKYRQINSEQLQKRSQ